MTELETYDAHVKLVGRKRPSSSNDKSQIPSKQRKISEHKSANDKQKN